MLKVVAITSSKRKMNTFNVVSQVKEILKKNNIEVEIINLFDYKIDTCIGCECCILKGECVLRDDTEKLMEKLIQCDGIILSSPVYLKAVSGKLKTFVDRTCAWFHRPVLYDKPLLVISTTKGSGLKSTLKYMESVGIQWGTINAGAVGRNIMSINKKVKEKECEKFIKYIKTDKHEYKPSLESILNFQMQKVLSRNKISIDKEYWDKKNWDKSQYYFNCKINPFKRAVGSSTFKILNKIINKQ